MSNKQLTTVTGKQTEAIAADYLAGKGLKIVDKNFRCRFGEIDLIALDKDCLVFIEVRYRQNEQYMKVSETVDSHKLGRLITTSELYLARNKKNRYRHCRYDFIGITGELESPVIEWIKNAFQA